VSIIIGLGAILLFWIFCLSGFGKKLELAGKGGWIQEIVEFIFSKIKRFFRWLYTTHVGAFVFMSIFSMFAVSLLFFHTLNPFSMMYEIYYSVKYTRIKNLEREGGHEEYVRKFKEKDRREFREAQNKRLAKDPKGRQIVENVCYKWYIRYVAVKKELLRDINSEIKKFNAQCKSKYDNESCKGYYDNIYKNIELLSRLHLKERDSSSGYCSFPIKQPDGLVKRKYNEFHRMEKPRMP